MKIRAISNIHHDGTMYESGVQFDIQNAAGQALIDMGVAAPVREAAKPAGAPTPEEIQAQADLAEEERVAAEKAKAEADAKAKA